MMRRIGQVVAIVAAGAVAGAAVGVAFHATRLQGDAVAARTPERVAVAHTPAPTPNAPQRPAPSPSPFPTPLPPPPPDERARMIFDSMGVGDVRVVWTTDARNCGGPRGGCFRTDTPDVVYVSPDLTGHVLAYVLAHEAAHVRQWRDGVVIDECDADARASAYADISPSPYECGWH